MYFKKKYIRTNYFFFDFHQSFEFDVVCFGDNVLDMPPFVE
jgi:hypothetical protein